MRRSMSRKGNCWDTQPIESFFNSPKNEQGDGCIISGLWQAKNRGNLAQPQTPTGTTTYQKSPSATRRL
jgi:transposase InsO family protein